MFWTKAKTIFQILVEAQQDCSGKIVFAMLKYIKYGKNMAERSKKTSLWNNKVVCFKNESLLFDIGRLIINLYLTFCCIKPYAASLGTIQNISYYLVSFLVRFKLS